ncbi:MAG: hypothetical protein EAZ60_15250 [Oscillatoriales cyanobacterium]|nr:MAG: hypothetical protein EAZ60_15250 [Oscillatoriales cyanobacterium]
MFVGYDSHAFHPPLTEYAIVGEFPSALLTKKGERNFVPLILISAGKSRVREVCILLWIAD